MANHYRYQLRGDTASNWSLANPVLGKNEPGFDMTNKRFKMGDGVTSWNELPYVTPEEVTDYLAEAPIDGQTYGRKDGHWQILEYVTPDDIKDYLDDAVEDGQTYGRRNGQWVILEYVAPDDIEEYLDDYLKDAPSDNKTYGRKNKHWVSIETLRTTPISDPEMKEINETGETNITFFVPWKYAMNTSRNVLGDVGHLAWKFPYTEGTITKVSVYSKTAGANIDLLVDGASVLGEPKAVTTEWVDYNANFPIVLNQALEVFTTENFLASDLTISVTMQIGNKTIEFFGEPDIIPNVYVRGSQAAIWGADGQETKDGLFRSVYMPAVERIVSLVGGWQAEDEYGQWYICGSVYFYPNTGSTTVFRTPARINDIPDTAHGEMRSGYKQGGYSEVVQEAGGGTQTYTVSSSYTWKISILSDNKCLLQKAAHTYTTQYSTYNPKTNTTSKGNPTKTTVGNSTQEIEFRLLQSDIGNYGGAVLAADGLSFYCFNINTSKDDSMTMSIQTSLLPEDMDINKFCRRGDTIYFKTNKDMYLRSFTCKHPTQSSFEATVDMVDCDGREVLDFWTGSNGLFVLTEDNALYVTGISTNGALGLSPVEGLNNNANYPDFVRVGFYDAKKIENSGNSTFLLTANGELYHSGAAVTNLVDAHVAFTRVFENYYFYDIAFANNTLVAIAERLGDMPEGD